MNDVYVIKNEMTKEQMFRLRLKEAVLRILNDGKLARELGGKGRRRAEKYFTTEKVTEQTLEIYRKPHITI